MNINLHYPEKVLWKIDLTDVRDPLDLYGRETRKKIRKDLLTLEQYNYEYKFEDLTPELLKRFITIYEKYIGSKVNGRVHDVYDALIINPPHKFPYKMLNLYNDDEYLGSKIFSMRDIIYRGAYKYFPTHTNIKLHTSLAKIAEYYFIKYTIDNHMPAVSSGTDINGFGSKISSSIGLALFKLQTGYRPYLLVENIIFKDEVVINSQEDVVIFHNPDSNSMLQNVTFFSTKTENELRDKYKVLFKANLSTEIVKI